MSGRYVSRVLESGLARPLTATAIACATLADDKTGERIWPSMDYLAWLARKSVRSVQTAVHTLTRMEILVVVRPAGRYRPVHYRMDLTKLPGRAGYTRRHVMGATSARAQAADTSRRVQSAGNSAAASAALMGAKSAAFFPFMGAKAVAPDPSERDPSHVQAPALPLWKSQRPAACRGRPRNRRSRWSRAAPTRRPLPRPAPSSAT